MRVFNSICVCKRVCAYTYESLLCVCVCVCVCCAGGGCPYSRANDMWRERMDGWLERQTERCSTKRHLQLECCVSLSLFLCHSLSLSLSSSGILSLSLSLFLCHSLTHFASHLPPGEMPLLGFNTTDVLLELQYTTHSHSLTHSHTHTQTHNHTHTIIHTHTHTHTLTNTHTYS